MPACLPFSGRPPCAWRGVPATAFASLRALPIGVRPYSSYSRRRNRECANRSLGYLGAWAKRRHLLSMHPCMHAVSGASDSMKALTTHDCESLSQVGSARHPVSPWELIVSGACGFSHQPATVAPVALMPLHFISRIVHHRVRVETLGVSRVLAVQLTLRSAGGGLGFCSPARAHTFLSNTCSGLTSFQSGPCVVETDPIGGLLALVPNPIAALSELHVQGRFTIGCTNHHRS